MFYVHHYTQQERSTAELALLPPTARFLKGTSGYNVIKQPIWESCCHDNPVKAIKTILRQQTVFSLCCFYAKNFWWNDKSWGVGFSMNEGWEGPWDYFFSSPRIESKQKLTFWLNTALYWKLWKKSNKDYFPSNYKERQPKTPKVVVQPPLTEQDYSTAEELRNKHKSKGGLSFRNR